MKAALLTTGLLAALLSAGCASGSGCSPTQGTGDVQQYAIHVGSYPSQGMYMAPNSITVAKCSKVQFVVTNDDTTFHDLSLMNYGGPPIEHDAEAGQTVVTHHLGNDYFVAYMTGTFEVKCQVAGHADLGMRGTFTVN